MLNRFALRQCTVRALRGKTLAGAKVMDSEIGNIEDVAAAAPQPVIVVYTDDSHYHVGSRDLFKTSGDTRVETGWLGLIVEIALTQRMQIDEDGTIDVVQPKTSAALELNIDLIERQVLAALTDPTDPWAEMWREFAPTIADTESRRGSLARESDRFAGRQRVIQVQMPKEPAPGQPIGPLWSKFLALCDADADLAPLVPILRALLDGKPLSDVEKLMAAFNLTRGEAGSFGYVIGSGP